jgi:N-acetylglutamate synthase-like GNAT family acetyltransferase
MSSPSVKIGPIKPAEIPEADRIFRLAFGTFLGIPDPATFMGDRDLVASRIRGKHVEALAARENGRLIGFNMLTTWGSFAFFGPLCVLPKYWDKGVAQKLLESTVAAFDRAELPRTGLFTFPHSAKHVGLYNKFGYWPQQLTALFRYTPEPASGPADPSLRPFVPLSTLSRSEREQAITACRKLAGSIEKGLDLTEEIQSLLRQHTGEVLLTYTRNTLDGFAIACTGPGSEGGSEICYLKFAAVRGAAAADGRFDSLLDACEHFARTRKIALEFGLSFACEAAYRRVRARKLRPFTHGVAMQRPSLPGFYRQDAYVLSDLR